jgi:hypothetical protein
VLYGWPVYPPWALFVWWFAFEAYAPEAFDAAGLLAGMSGFMGAAAAIVGSLWRARQGRMVTTYGPIIECRADSRDHSGPHGGSEWSRSARALGHPPGGGAGRPVPPGRGVPAQRPGPAGGRAGSLRFY